MTSPLDAPENLEWTEVPLLQLSRQLSAASVAAAENPTGFLQALKANGMPMEPIDFSTLARPRDTASIPPVDIFETQGARLLGSIGLYKHDTNGNPQILHAPSRYNRIPAGMQPLAIQADILVQWWITPKDLPNWLKIAYYGSILSMAPNFFQVDEILAKYPDILSKFPRVKNYAVQDSQNKMINLIKNDMQ